MKKRDLQLNYLEDQVTLEKDAYIKETQKNTELKSNTDNQLAELTSKLKHSQDAFSKLEQ